MATIMTAPGTHLSLALSLFAMISAAPAQQATADKGSWKQLFNGKDLSGWTPKITGHALGDNFGNTFRVEDGLLKVRYDAYKNFGGKFGHLFCNTEFSDYRFRVEYRFVGDQVPGGPGWAFRNSGVMVHGQPAASLSKDQDFPVSIEVQLLGGKEKGQRPTGNLCTPGTNVVRNGKLVRRHCMNSSSETYRGDRWVTAEIEVIGNQVKHIIEGKTVFEYSDPQLDERDGNAKKLLAAGSPKMLRRGSISLQSESHPIDFRKVEILDLSKKPAKPAEPQIKTPPGFLAETVYDVPRKQGSWVSLCVDDKQRMIACDQGGKLHRVTLSDSGGSARVAALKTDVGRAQGLLHAFGSLYVMGKQAKKSGLFRLTDTNDDDQYDKVEHLMRMPVGGEHHAHAIILSPDKKSLYVACGNMTRNPKPDFSHARMAQNFEHEDLIPRMPDARGHNTDAATIGGWVARISPDGSRRELISNGYRNQYDIAFNEHGELFTYDSDMEYDIGSPWYRPTRVCHVTSGSEFGWRFGTGKWPAYSPDSLPGVIDIGPGSPTGIVFGLGARFPAKYQRALYICDWSYGKIYAVHMQASGSSYTATKEVFASAAPFPVTDIVVHPNGSMYFAVGGRGAKSALYRISYTGTEATAPITPTADAGSKLRKLRHKIEAAHSTASAQDLKTLFEHLSHADRHIRYAARIAIEKHPVSAWRSMALKSSDPRRTTLGVLALARHDKAGSHYQLLEKLVRIDIGTLAAADQLDLLRVYGVALWRMRNIKSPPKVLSEIGAQLDRNYPSTNPWVNQELCRVLSKLDHPKVAAKTVKLLTAALTQEEQLHYAYCLRIVTRGWTKELRTEYFQWFGKGLSYRGGASFLGFCKNIRKDAIARMPKADAAEIAELLKTEPKAQAVTAIDKTRKFVKNWTVAELTPLLTKKTSGHNFARGREMFGVTACARCHRFQGEGGSVGPDLTGLGGRYGIQEILESIIEPSKVISDQYQATVFELENDKIIIGYVANYGGGSAKVAENMLEPGKFTNVPVNKIKSKSPSPISMMPPGLLMILTAEEIQDLVAYMRSGGNPDHPLFKK